MIRVGINLALACIVAPNALAAWPQSENAESPVPERADRRVDESFFLRTSVGANVLASVPLESRSGPAGTISNMKIDFDTGIAWSLDLGWQASDLLSFELSTGIMYNDIDSASGTIEIASPSFEVLSGSIPLGGDVLQVPLMLGLGIDLPILEEAPLAGDAAMRLRFGVAGGGVFVRGALDDLGPLQGDEDTDMTWAMALSAALEWEWSERNGPSSYSLGITYRFVGTGSSSFDAFGIPGLIESKHAYNHQVMGTLGIRF